MKPARKIIIALVLTATAASAVRADQITDTRGLSYQGGITDYRRFTVSIRLPNRKIIKKKLSGIRSLELTANDAFRRAEKLLEKKKFAEALSAYEEALQSAGTQKPWLKPLIRDRMYQATVKAGLLGRAMKRWLAMIDGTDPKSPAWGLQPNTFGPKGSPANRSAIKSLDAKLSQLQARGAPKVCIARLLKLKMKIQEADDDNAGATQTAEMLSKLTAASVPTTDKSPTKPTGDVAAPPAGASDLDVMKRLLKSQKADEVIQKIQASFQDYKRSELPAALLLLGKAQLLKYDQGGKKDKTLLKKAGLNFMWIYAEFGFEAQAPEALYLAAGVNRELNDATAYKRALRELVNSYGGSEENPWATRAAKELAELKD